MRTESAPITAAGPETSATTAPVALRGPRARSRVLAARVMGIAAGTALLLGPLTAAPRPAHATTGACDDALMTAAPGWVTGDPSAVAITSQSLDADIDGWLHISWEAAASTELRAVVVRQPDGVVTLTGTVDRGMLEDVLEVTFCGTTSPDARAPASDDSEPDDAVQIVAAPAPDDEQPAASSAEGGDGTADGAGSEAATTGAAAPTATSQFDRVVAEGLTAERELDPAAMPAAGATDESDVEVMGIQLVREGAPAGTESSPLPWLLSLLGVIAAGAAGLTLLWYRAQEGGAA